MDEKWELDSAKDGDTRYFVIHGQLPKGINGDFGYPVCDTMNRHHCISPDEDEANARLIAAAPELLEALEKLECPDCSHPMKLHADRYGCEFDRGDREINGLLQAACPCGCNVEHLQESFPDFVRVIAALRKAKGQ